MFIRVSNKLYIENPTLPIIDYCSKVLTIDNPTYLIALKLGKRTSYIPRTINLYERNGDTYVLPSQLQIIFLISDWSINFNRKQDIKITGA